MVCQDAFVLSHTMMQTDIPTQEEVERFLPELDLPHRVADRPVTVGGLDFPHETEAHRKQHEEAMRRVPAVHRECQDAFEELFGRRPADAVVPYKMDDAELVLLSMGTTASTVRQAVDRAREQGIRAGSLRVRMFRPFPERELRAVLAGHERIGVIDRDISLGSGGVLWAEARGAAPPGSLVQNYVVGLGGGDIRPGHVLELYEDLRRREAPSEPEIVEVGS
jgi:pyruvate/2-oxoacid:ferredoxin oxidoreductase alpha subunit